MTTATFAEITPSMRLRITAAVDALIALLDDIDGDPDDEDGDEDESHDGRELEDGI